MPDRGEPRHGGIEGPMLRLLILILRTFVGAVGAESTIYRHSVQVTVTVETDEQGQELVGRFMPDAQQQPLHLYSKDRPTGGPGIVIRLALATVTPVQDRGPRTADAPIQDPHGLSVYADEATVVLRLPITVASGSVSAAIPLHVSYMACSAEACLEPVLEDPLSVWVAGSGTSAAHAHSAITSLTERETLLRELLVPICQELQHGISRDLIESRVAAAIHWQRPRNRQEVEDLISKDHADGKSELLDFTGSSCLNCQVMAKTVFRQPAIHSAWNATVPVEVDTVPPHADLAQWKHDRFGTQSRPLYVRLGADGQKSQWYRIVAPDDAVAMGQFENFFCDAVATLKQRTLSLAPVV